HTEFSPSDSLRDRWSGSPDSLVAAPFMPATLKMASVVGRDCGEPKPSPGGLTCAASAMLILDFIAVAPGRGSVIGVPFACKSDKMSPTLLLGSFSSRSAKAPATCGAAIEVPLLESNAPPGMDELM